MADAVDTLTVFKGTKRATFRFLNRSDATGESNVIKIDVSTFTGPTGAPATKIVIEEVQWTIQGFSSVQFNWDHTVADEALVLSGVGYLDVTGTGGLRDPASAGGTGDLLLTTYGAAANATYDIVMTVRFK